MIIETDKKLPWVLIGDAYSIPHGWTALSDSESQDNNNYMEKHKAGFLRSLQQYNSENQDESGS